ncbi:acetyl-CoA carboxylase, carboxyltransferase component (subunits alpha and beta) [Desulfosporosinus acidiphilus SJ4]|uniref:Acetyl-CoA carboxylase, carboxyltransferase component (Subunits alpha and beta) n=1 Tax=Desulfosporosinus acidiphilus (strain DSM 22704 / JCM 16185 / SJ4) TaxID=646529 RepID=I4D4Z8_DESAJ|nr:carboxyl transferase domain-containing protein [Desulfosporosinus acidiphilus]AFM40872.1 acetyl-CoA carboxylase, carboxyltransferase component (subunits alpha and beta) [Desulfosporosinus acidiphilus SJ4]
MDIYAKLSELTALQEAAKLGGGIGRINRQHENGKMTARERIDHLLDAGSFIETDTFIKGEMTDFTKPDVVNVGEGVVTGYGTIHGRLVYVFSQDFTVFGGALGELHSRKICKIMDLALKNGAPVIGLNDSGGARIQEGVSALSAYGDIFYRNTLVSGVIPQISVIMGPCAGGAVYSPAITDFTFMVETTSQMFITGPQVIKSVTGEEVTTEELGGAMVHNHTSGVAHFLYPSETETLVRVRDLLTYLPQNNLEESPILEDRPPDTEADALLKVVPIEPNKQYDVRDVLNLIVDGGELFEVHQHFAQNIVTSFARFAGMSVGIVANQAAYLAGCLDIDASDKLSRFVRFCDCFNIPLVTFVDVPGFLPGVDQEYRGIIRHGAKILYAYSEATVPKITIILRKAYGGAYVAMCSRSLGADVAVAWPTAEIAVMGPDGAANIIFREEIMKSADPKATMKQRTEEYREKFANPYIASAKGLIDNVIDPRDTRKIIIQSLNMLNSKRETHPRKKHGNIPY